ncbi:hypothetical protein C0989_008737 [Termitomyces sp. Mn162]|nr:hypothetical protein C0989_008737 [Termitomyces sp. Mn162]
MDRTLGVGTQDDGPLLVLTATTMMKVSMNLNAILAYDIEYVFVTILLKQLLNLAKKWRGQACQVCHDSGNLVQRSARCKNSFLHIFSLTNRLRQNPLQFSLPPDLDEESLMQGAQQLSQAVLESDPDIIQKNHDLGAQLTERKERLSWLIRFINDNAVLGKISQQCRQKLATDAEKLFAVCVFATPNPQSNQSFARTSPAHSILNDAVHAYMQEINEGHHEDVIRAFFRLRVVDIGRLVGKVGEAATQAARLTQRDIIEFLPEANRIVLTVLNSAFDYRDYNLQVYGIDLPMITPWSSKPAVIDVVLGLFDATTKAIEAPSSGHRTKSDSEPGTQLPDLAAALFTCIQERLDWLGSPFAMSEPGYQRDREELSKKFDMLRPEVFETLRRNGYANAAFSLAEKYRDFSGLASLCHKDTVYPPESNPNFLRIQAYIERFKDGFTTELYRWYIQHGELRVMFAHDDSHSPHIDKYFAENPSNSISWINDLGKERYSIACATLLKEAGHAGNLDAKHLMLSIGKLAHLAQLHESNTGAADSSLLDAFHDDLDFVSVHEALLQEFRSALDAIRGRQTLDSQIDTIVKATATGLQEKPALKDIFKDLVRGLLQGRALCIEDAVDVLTLKDNDSSLEDFATALHLLARVQNLPEARITSAFRTVWRRVYIHDECVISWDNLVFGYSTKACVCSWDAIRKTANVSDAELSARFRSTALYNTLCAIITKDHQPAGYETSPDEALVTPTMTEITSRWPGLTQEQVEALVQDYNLECDLLGDLDLNDVFHRVRELAVHDVEW